MSNVHVRQARAGDVSAMIDLLGELFSIEADFTADMSLQRRGLSMLLEPANDSDVFVAEVDGELAGMCTIQTLISTAEGGPVGLVEDVTVKAGLRGQGVGTRLMEAAEAMAAERGLLRLQLLADHENWPAMGFYAKRGWSTTQLVCLRKKRMKAEG